MTTIPIERVLLVNTFRTIIERMLDRRDPRICVDCFVRINNHRGHASDCNIAPVLRLLFNTLTNGKKPRLTEDECNLAYNYHGSKQKCDIEAYAMAIQSVDAYNCPFRVRNVLWTIPTV